jgi:hypothetical protein
LPQTRELTDKKVVCEYLFYRLHGKKSYNWVKLPLVEIKLRSAQAEYGSIGLVDSGSDKTFIQKQEADLLGLKSVMRGDEPATGEAIGAGGELPCDIMTLPELQLMKHGMPFCSFRGLSVWVPKREGAIPYSIIGRDTAFRRFEIAFDEGRKRMTFKRT